MKEYLDLLSNVLENGEDFNDRSDCGSICLFGTQFRMNLQEGFPLVTTRKTYWKGALTELLWFFRKGENTNLKWLNDNGVKYWDHWKKNNHGDLGTVYGYMLTNVKYENGQNQLDRLVTDLRTNPQSRRHILNFWQVPHIDNGALPPCHVMAQFHVSNDNKLSCNVSMRSLDIPIGCPFDIAMYAFLTHMLCNMLDFGLGDLVFSIGNAHIYKNQIEGVKEQLKREPHVKPNLIINSKRSSLYDYKIDDFEIINYKSHENIKYPIVI
jgi:thymidylate synthase